MDKQSWQEKEELWNRLNNQNFPFRAEYEMVVKYMGKEFADTKFSWFERTFGSPIKIVWIVFIGAIVGSILFDICSQIGLSEQRNQQDIEAQIKQGL